MALPPTLSRVDNVFHMSMFQRYIPDLSHVQIYEHLELDEELCYKDKPFQILDQKDEVVRIKMIILE